MKKRYLSILKRDCFASLAMTIIAFILVVFAVAGEAHAAAECKACRVDEGVICIKRGPCEPINTVLLEAARDCRAGGPGTYEPVTKLAFLDIFSQVVRLDREMPGVTSQLSDEQRYELESRLAAEKGISVFINTNPQNPLTRKELVSILKPVDIEDDMGFSTGLADQSFNLNNEKLVVYDPALYVDEGKGFELWERRQNFSQSQTNDKHYVAKIDDCDNARVVFGDNKNARIPSAGARLKIEYKVMGRQDDTVTKCEVVALLSNPAIA